MKTLKSIHYLFAALVLAGGSRAQTRIDLKGQAKAVDFSTADATRPSKTGVSLPEDCAAGETFLKLDAAPGRNWYICTAKNQWSLQGADMPAAAPENQNTVLTSDGSAAVWRNLGGDLSGAPDALRVSRIQGRSVSQSQPTQGQALTWSGSSWEPQTPPQPAMTSVFGRTGAVTAQAGDYQFGQIGGTVSNSQLPPLGGDLSGAQGAATVSRLQNRPLAASAPATGQALIWNGAQWEPQNVAAGVTSAFGRTGAITGQTGDYQFGQIGGTISESQLPPLGGDISGTQGAATVSGLRNRPVGAGAPESGQTLTWTGAEWAPRTPPAAPIASVFGRTGAITARAGDYAASQITNAADVTRPNTYAAGSKQAVAGDAAAAGLQVIPSALPVLAQAGDMVVDAADANQLKLYDGSTWVTLNPAPAHANYALSFTGQSAVTVYGSTHQLGTANLIVSCYDNNAPANLVEPSTISVDPDSFDVTVRFPGPQSGRCVINGFNGATGTGAGGAEGAVRTVFGRAGDVVAATGDYSFAQISGAVASGQIASGVDAAKIGDGTVSNQAYGYLRNATGDLQAQLDGKAPASHTHTVAGDVTGGAESTTVAALRGRAVSGAAPADGQVLTWNAAASQWQPAAPPAGGGSGAAGMAAQLGDFAITRTSATTLLIGDGCSAATPCNVRFGGRSYSFTSSMTATISAGDGTAYFYITPDGVLTVGHSMSVACAGTCAAASGVQAFPNDSIPLYSWNATGGSWENSGMDRRGWISQATILPGAGIVVVDSGGQTIVGVDGAIVPGYLSGSVALDFPQIAAGTCSADLALTVIGAAAGDSVAPGWPGGLESGLIGMMRVSAPDQIAVRLCAMGQDIDPASAVFTATIIRGF